MDVDCFISICDVFCTKKENGAGLTAYECMQIAEKIYDAAQPLIDTGMDVLAAMKQVSGAIRAEMDRLQDAAPGDYMN